MMDVAGSGQSRYAEPDYSVFKRDNSVFAFRPCPIQQQVMLQSRSRHRHRNRQSDNDTLGRAV